MPCRSDNFIWVYGGSSEGWMGHEPAEAGYQCRCLGHPKLWEVTVICHWVGSVINCLCLEFELRCFAFMSMLSFLSRASWSWLYLTASRHHGTQVTAGTRRRFLLFACGLFVTMIMSQHDDIHFLMQCTAVSFVHSF